MGGGMRKGGGGQGVMEGSIRLLEEEKMCQEALRKRTM